MEDFAGDEMKKLVVGRGREKMGLGYEKDFGEGKEGLVRFEGMVKNLEGGYGERGCGGMGEL
ncbi:hypothetical protein, partial [Paenibacillus xylanexedens]|uniref:hypothetical protein n=1 Tax=Paenibacillus xylanexedens TaxID=528191 RepID=UPI001C92DE75